MIIGTLLFLIAVGLKIITALFSFFNFLLPDNITDSVTFFFDKLHNLDFIFPVSTLMSALSIYITFIGMIYLIKMFMWVYHVVRHGGDADIPTLGKFSNSSLSRQGQTAGVREKARQDARS